ncbi:MAG TPA: mandelate racemase/muconate lactonizing enzyme family protein [Trueperaceae bacterium]|nr:mandelate racemase/muconate lactonizing enzyme family protein [Trueperaceae bacterium]
MRITDVEALVLRMPHIDVGAADSTQDALIVRVHTDEGIVGIGEVDASPTVVKAVIDAPPSHAISSGLREILIGEDPRDIERLWDKMYQGSVFYGRRGVAIMALSGLDIALYDILGKKLGVPVYRLLGGARRKSVPAYASTLMPDTPEEAQEHASELAARGFKAMKFGWGPFGQSEDLDEELVAAVRRGAGEQVEILLDIGFGWRNADHAIKMTRRIERYRPFWIEEPLLPDDVDGYARLAGAVDVPIAAGEENTTRYEFSDLLERGRVDIVQPDVTRCGGLTEAKRIAALAHARGKPCVPHAWSTGVISAASLHLIATIPNALFLEYCVRPNPLNTSLVKNPVQVKDGVATVPEAPGLGVELDEAELARFAVQA